LTPETPCGWEAPVLEASVVFIDLEMSGLDPEIDRVVQLCLERSDGAALRSFVRAPLRDPVARRVHGITEADLASAPPFEALAAEVASLLEGAVVVAHGADHDVAFLRAELARAGRSWDPPYYLDTLRLARLAFPGRRSHGLAALAADLGIEHAVPHRADHDVRALRGLWPHLLSALKPQSMRALWELGHAPRRVRPEVLESAARAQALARPVMVRYRAAGRGIREFGFCVRDVRADLDPPLVLGYLHRSRGRRELRADRILTIEPLAHDPAD
jgi:DNA polymerase-3 subunit epsilon